jgi:two-component sensor histidine kinase
VIDRAPSDFGFRGGHLLPVAELLHRVRNEYARTISLASVVAAKASNAETKAALRDIISHLTATAEIHSVLCPPVDEGHADLTDVLTRLCRVMTASSEFQYRGIKLELRVERPVLIDAAQCWRASLVVAELINNSFRHAFASRSGCIFVSVGESFDRAFCNVIDDGSPVEIGGAGLGTRIVDALAAELDGLVERRFSNSGARVTLSFPKRAPIAVSEHPVGKARARQARDFSPIVEANVNRF